MMTLRHVVLVLIGVGLLISANCCDVQPGPPCDLQCFENAHCNLKNNVCVCDDFFVMSGDWTECLPLAAIPYNSICEENSQCPARMGKGAICSEGICVCKDGFHYLHGKCYTSSGYGEPCSQEEDCYATFSYESVSCVENKCKCSEGYYLVGGSFCRRMGKEGEECMFDMDCKFDDGYCVDNICASKNKTDDNVFSSTGTSEFQRPADLSKEPPEINLGSECETSGDCLAGINDTECYANLCVCKPGYSEVDHLCKPDLGESCSEEGALEYIEEAECRGNLLRCKAPYFIAKDNRQCRAGRDYGTQCQSPEQCLFIGDHAACRDRGDGRIMCLCADGYHFADEINLCVQTKGIGDQCDQSYECVVTSGNVTCTDDACTCLEGFHATKGDCVPDVKALNDSCLDTTDCATVIGNSFCVNSTCQCKSGYFADLATNTSCLTGIGGTCSKDHDCDAVNSSCNVTKCACDNSTIPSMDMSKCLEVAGAFEDECEEDSQCYETLGSEGSACVEGTCTCKEDYHFRNKLCRKKKLLGESCDQNSQCYLESNETSKIECRNGLCQCGYEYTQTEDLDCKSGVSGKSSSLGLVIGILMCVLLRQTKWN